MHGVVVLTPLFEAMKRLENVSVVRRIAGELVARFYLSLVQRGLHHVSAPLTFL